VRELTTLREFKAKYLAKLLNLRKQLLEKYPERRERAEFIVDMLISKLEHLRTYTLSDYLYTLHLATKEFKELETIIPPSEEVEELLEHSGAD
jgi:restriction endonuclease S subunit